MGSFLFLIYRVIIPNVFNIDETRIIPNNNGPRNTLVPDTTVVMTGRRLPLQS